MIETSSNEVIFHVASHEDFGIESQFVVESSLDHRPPTMPPSFEGKKRLSKTSG